MAKQDASPSRVECQALREVSDVMDDVATAVLELEPASRVALGLMEWAANLRRAAHSADAGDASESTIGTDATGIAHLTLAPYEHGVCGAVLVDEDPVDVATEVSCVVCADLASA